MITAEMSKLFTGLSKLKALKALQASASAGVALRDRLVAFGVEGPPEPAEPSSSVKGQANLAALPEPPGLEGAVQDPKGDEESAELKAALAEAEAQVIMDIETTTSTKFGYGSIFLTGLLLNPDDVKASNEKAKCDITPERLRKLTEFRRRGWVRGRLCDCMPLPRRVNILDHIDSEIYSEMSIDEVAREMNMKSSLTLQVSEPEAQPELAKVIPAVVEPPEVKPPAESTEAEEVKPPAESAGEAEEVKPPEGSAEASAEAVTPADITPAEVTQETASKGAEHPQDSPSLKPADAVDAQLADKPAIGATESEPPLDPEAAASTVPTTSSSGTQNGNDTIPKTVEVVDVDLISLGSSEDGAEVVEVGWKEKATT